jgi:maleate cis-trans isomerase
MGSCRFVALAARQGPADAAIDVPIHSGRLRAGEVTKKSFKKKQNKDTSSQCASISTEIRMVPVYSCTKILQKGFRGKFKV